MGKVGEGGGVKQNKIKTNVNKLRSITYSSQDLSQTVSNTSIISDSGRGFPFKEGFLSSAFLSALLI